MSTIHHEPSNGTVAARILAIADDTDDPALRALVAEVRALEDRQTFAEAALHHIAARLGVDLSSIPDPLMPRLHTEVTP